MKRKKIMIGLIGAVLLLAGCGKLEKGTSNISPNQASGDKTATTGQLNDSSYQALLVDGKYKTGKARGVSKSTVNSNYNLSNVEKGLMEMSKTPYPVDKFLFQEGQYISREDIIQLISRQSDGAPLGLNPAEGGGPIIFEQIVEQNYLSKENEQLGGVSLGIVLNSVDYSTTPPVEIDDETVNSEGQRIAAKVLERVRTIKGVENIPITIGLFKQAIRDDVGGGSYFAKATSKSGNELSGWEEVNEAYLVLPAKEGEQNNATNDGLSNKFTDFKNSIQSFFPNSSGISGVAAYRNNELQKLTIVIETKYFSETEILNFTQFISTTVDTIFNINANIEVQVNTLEGPQGFVEKQVGSDKSVGHVFN